MKRDWNLVRSILLAAEERCKTLNEHGQPTSVQLNRPDEVQHAVWMSELGLIATRALQGDPYDAGFLFVQGLTSTGADVLDCIRNGKVWDDLKTTFGEPLNLPFDVLITNAKKFTEIQLQCDQSEKHAAKPDPEEPDNKKSK